MKSWIVEGKLRAYKMSYKNITNQSKRPKSFVIPFAESAKAKPKFFGS
jgi:hypothetical protein